MAWTHARDRLTNSFCLIVAFQHTYILGCLGSDAEFSRKCLVIGYGPDTCIVAFFGLSVYALLYGIIL